MQLRAVSTSPTGAVTTIQRTTPAPSWIWWFADFQQRSDSNQLGSFITSSWWWTRIRFNFCWLLRVINLIDWLIDWIGEIRPLVDPELRVRSRCRSSAYLMRWGTLIKPPNKFNRVGPTQSGPTMGRSTYVESCCFFMHSMRKGSVSVSHNAIVVVRLRLAAALPSLERNDFFPFSPTMI